MSKSTFEGIFGIGRLTNFSTGAASIKMGWGHKFLAYEDD